VTVDQSRQAADSEFVAARESQNYLCIFLSIHDLKGLRTLQSIREILHRIIGRASVTFEEPAVLSNRYEHALYQLAIRPEVGDWRLYRVQLK
jgi:hypothetical protein